MFSSKIIDAAVAILAEAYRETSMCSVNFQRFKNKAGVMMDRREIEQRFPARGRIANEGTRKSPYIIFEVELENCIFYDPVDERTLTEVERRQLGLEEDRDPVSFSDDMWRLP